MMPWRTWLMRFGVSGALLIVAGCGSGDIPDPSSDSQAAADPGASGGSPPVPVAAPAPPADTKVAADEGTAKPDESKPDETPATADASPPPSSSSPAPDKNSATAEMLAMATGGQPGANANPPANGDAAPAAGSGPAGGAGPPGGGSRPGMPGMPGMPGGMANMRPNAPGAGSGPSPGGMQAQMQSQMQNQAQMQNQMRAQMQNQPGGGRGAGMPGMPGMAGMPGSGAGPQGADNNPPDFHTPEGGVTAFLNALKARDLDRLTEATAIHAQVEAAAKNQEIFKRIYDGSLSEQELDNLAKKLEGFQLQGNNTPKSTARIDMIITKRGEQNSIINRLVTVRHEKRGWLVCDISGPAEFKNPRMTPFNTTPKRR